MDLALRRLGSGPPLLLVHGFASFGRFWDPIAERLARQHALLIPDLPGHGGSPSLPHTPSPDAMVDALEALLDGLGLGAVHVAGHSMGGLLALELASRGRAQSVCALAPSGFSTAAEKRRAFAILRGQRALGRALGPFVPRLARSAVARTLTMSLSATRPWAMDDEWAIATARNYLGTREFDAILEALDPNPLVERFAAIACPILLVYGERDLVVPARGAGRYRRSLPAHAGYRWIGGAGHALTTDAPEATATAILDATTSNFRPIRAA